MGFYLFYNYEHDLVALGHSPSWGLLHTLISHEECSKAEDSFQVFLFFHSSWQSDLNQQCLVLPFFFSPLPVMCQACIVTTEWMFLNRPMPYLRLQYLFLMAGNQFRTHHCGCLVHIILPASLCSMALLQIHQWFISCSHQTVLRLFQFGLIFSWAFSPW